VRELRAAVVAAWPAVDANATPLREPGCRAAIEGVPAERVEEALTPVGMVEIALVAHPLKPAFARFGQRLEAVRMRDRALRAGRSVTLPQIRAFVQIQPPRPTSARAGRPGARPATRPAEPRRSTIPASPP
jgi:hypothetical protein